MWLNVAAWPATVYVRFGLKADIARAQVMPSEQLIGMAHCNVRYPTITDSRGLGRVGPLLTLSKHWLLSLDGSG